MTLVTQREVLSENTLCGRDAAGTVSPLSQAPAAVIVCWNMPGYDRVHQTYVSLLITSQSPFFTMILAHDLPPSVHACLPAAPLVPDQNQLSDKDVFI